MTDDLTIRILTAGQDNAQIPGGNQQRGQGQEGVDHDLQRSLAPQLLGQSMGEIMALLNNRRRGTRVRSIRNMMGIPVADSDQQAAAGGDGGGREEESNSSYTVERIRVYTPSSFIRMFLPLGNPAGGVPEVESTASESSSSEAVLEETSASSAEPSPPLPGRTEASSSTAPPETVNAGQFVESSVETPALSSSASESSTAGRAASASAAAATTAEGIGGGGDRLSASSQRQPGGSREGGSGGQSQPPRAATDCVAGGSTEGGTPRDAAARGGDCSGKLSSLSPADSRSVSSSSPSNCERAAQSLPSRPDGSAAEAPLPAGDRSASLAGPSSKAIGLDTSVRSSLTSSCGLQKAPDTKTLEGLMDFEVD